MACTLFVGRRIELCYLCFQLLCAADEVRQKLGVDFGAVLIFGQIPLVVGLQKNLYVSTIRIHSMNECLEHRNSVFRTISLLTQRRECQSMCGPIRQIKLTICVCALVLSIGQMRSAERTMPSNSARDPGSSLSLFDPDEIVQFLFAH